MAERIAIVELEAFTDGLGSRRGYLSVVTESGGRLNVVSPSEPGEASGVARYELQKDSGVNLAKEQKVPFLEVDLDLITQVLAQRAKNIQTS